MAPMYGQPNYLFYDSEEYDELDEGSNREDQAASSLSEMAFWYMIILVSMLLLWLLIFFLLRIMAIRQKTRNPQQRRVYVGSRARQSLGAQEPSIYVSPSNLPPPPKYEYMAPPSYEEVVGVHYPNYNIQPISAPITTALANEQPAATHNVTVTNDSNQTVPNSNESVQVTVSNDERTTSVTVARS